MKKNGLLLLILSSLFLCSAGFANQDLNLVEKLTNRNKNYIPRGYKKIVQIGPRRTGSTLVFNILRYLFEDEDHIKNNGFNNVSNKVIKAHSANPFAKLEQDIYFVTIRNPVDCIYSLCNVEATLVDEKKIAEYTSEITETLKSINQIIAQGKKVIILKYEDFVNDMDKIFTSIEEAFSIKIDEKDKEFLKKALSKESVIAFSKKKSSFDDWDNVIHIHGNHITENKKKDETLINTIKNHLLPHNELLIKWGYLQEKIYAAVKLPAILDFGNLKPFCHIAGNEGENWELGHLCFNAAPEVGTIMAYLKKTFEVNTVIETGTFEGNTTIFFSYLFDDVHTIELNPEKHEQAKNKFQYYKNITCHKGSSDFVLTKLLPQLQDKKILFYLDAHWNQHWPLLREIEEISKTHKDRCILIIDDAKVPMRKDIPYDSHGNHECSYNYIQEKVKLAFTNHSIHYLIPSKKGSKAKLIILPKGNESIP